MSSRFFHPSQNEEKRHSSPSMVIIVQSVDNIEIDYHFGKILFLGTHFLDSFSLALFILSAYVLINSKNKKRHLSARMKQDTVSCSTRILSHFP